MRRSNDAVNPAQYYPLIDIFRFLLVSLNVDAILQASTIHRRRERLNKITDGLGLGDAYDTTIERIKAQDGDKPKLGLEALMWVSHAERPLTAGELCHALAIELGSKDFNDANTPSISTLVGCCQGLITVNKEGSTVRLVHFTLEEYLSANPDIFSRPHSKIAEICLTYLNSERVKAIPADRSTDTGGPPFLEYCSMYWGVHAKRDLSDPARSLSLELFRGYDGHISRKFLLVGHLGLNTWRFKDLATSSRFKGLHCASFFGIAGVVAALIEMKCHDINEGDFQGYTPLAWAARNGHEEAVKVLLKRGKANPDERDNDGKTPLLLAAWHGHEEVVKILLGVERSTPTSQIFAAKRPSYAA